MSQSLFWSLLYHQTQTRLSTWTRYKPCYQKLLPNKREWNYWREQPGMGPCLPGILSLSDLSLQYDWPVWKKHISWIQYHYQTFVGDICNKVKHPFHSRWIFWICPNTSGLSSVEPPPNRCATIYISVPKTEHPHYSDFLDPVLEFPSLDSCFNTYYRCATNKTHIPCQVWR